MISTLLRSAATLALFAPLASASGQTDAQTVSERWETTVRLERLALVPADSAEPAAPMSEILQRRYGYFSWIRPDDLPVNLRNAPLWSETDVELDIDSNGRATACRVRSPGADPRLDQLACALLPERGRFEPLYGGPGRPIASRWTMRVSWRNEKIGPWRILPPAPTPAPAHYDSFTGVLDRLQTGWPRLLWAEHAAPVSLPSIQAAFPRDAPQREGMVSLDLSFTAREGITGCRVGVSSGDRRLDEAACAVARGLRLRYFQACTRCDEDPLPLQIVWKRRGGSHIRLPLLTSASVSAPRRNVSLPRDPADTRSEAVRVLDPRIDLPVIRLSEADFADLPDRMIGGPLILAEFGTDSDRGGCSILLSSGNPGVDRRACEELAAEARRPLIRDVFGDPAIGRVPYVIRLEFAR